MKRKGMSALCLCLALGLSAFTGGILANTGDAAANSGASSAPATASTQDTVNINTATAQQLTQLQGIGARRAEAIVQYRDENGPFTDIEQLQEVPGIGPTLIENNRARLVL
ncbi:MULTISPECIES: ComEA family DNA-binding protein [unclassified Symbiopectobacterium]|uniref:ComEA family DNA-binding protein n=1 Tax=unclassified Symbiopectobacterium TaxID=2794573 RepID=UPI0022267E60|nr:MULTISPECIES: ComEA family DNA-binding protein [unclassified Symbiopectobacterium]MCW2474754.1 helix-hairpin-helix domain-containing protein [Candidatus Symbiopectobacterium sp. NZEC151]MCW2487518.1 helix-hairpin-helix domain-containing protein [Candidatus Symbiopectobacterium sp. NZEC127]